MNSLEALLKGERVILCRTEDDFIKVLRYLETRHKKWCDGNPVSINDYRLWWNNREKTLLFYDDKFGLRYGGLNRSDLYIPIVPFGVSHAELFVGGVVLNEPD